MTTLGVGLVGCGLIGRKRAMNLPTGAHLIACHDHDSVRAIALADDLPHDVVVTQTVDELVTRDDIDFVIVATTHDALAGIAIAAIEHGRHVLVEKPGATRARDLERVCDRARANAVVARVGFNHRFHPALRRCREIVQSGRYGPLLFVRARYGHGGRLGYESEWRADPARSGGGELVDQGSHLIDLVQSMFGSVDLAFAELPSAFWDAPVEDNCFLALRPRSGGFAWLHASWTEWKNLFSFEIMLQTAKLEVNGLGGSYGSEQLTVYEMHPEMGPPTATTCEFAASDDSWRDELVDVMAAIRGGPTIGASADDAVAVLQVIAAAYAS